MRTRSIGRLASRGAVALAVAWTVAGMPSASAGGGHPGTLDRSFGHAGRLTKAFGSADAFGMAVAHQGAEIVVAGTHELQTTADVAVARMLPGGRPDRTFGGDGRVTVDLAGTYDEANAVAALPHGKILVAGTRTTPTTDTFLALRLTSNGRLDHTFGGGDGFVTTGFGAGSATGYAMTVLADGRFVICGATTSGANSSAALARYRPDGKLDRTFGGDGRVVAAFPGQTQSACIGVTHDGNETVMSGWAYDGATTNSIALARFGPAGMPDARFDTDGYVLSSTGTYQSSAQSVVALPSGGVAAAGYEYNPGTSSLDVMLLQLTRQGQPDAGFGGGDGIVVVDFGGDDTAHGLVRQADGKFIVAGSRDDDMIVVRFLKGGARDATFGKDGLQAKPWGGRSDGRAAVLMKGKVVVAGSLEKAHYRMAVERVFAG